MLRTRAFDDIQEDLSEVSVVSVQVVHSSLHCISDVICFFAPDVTATSTVGADHDGANDDRVSVVFCCVKLWLIRLHCGDPLLGLLVSLEIW